jgi:hypothetical protein
MRKLAYFLLCLLAYGCQTEADVAPATGNFIRYFGSEYNHNAVLARETDDGLALLSNVDVQSIKDPTKINYKIKFIRTDADGNLLAGGEKNYPEFPEKTEDDTVNFKGASFIALANSGYLIAGERINANGTSDLLLLRLDQEGTLTDSITTSLRTPTTPGTSLHGRAVIQDPDDQNFIVLGWIENNGSNDMYVAKYNAGTLDKMWERQYGAGTSSLVNRLYNSGSYLLWAGSVQASTDKKSSIRFVRAPEDAQTSINGNPITQTEFNQVANDFCPSIGGWSATGSSDVHGDDDILVMKTSNFAEPVFAQVIKKGGSVEEGNSIAQLSDGHLVVLGTADTKDNQKDLYLAKIDGLGARTADGDPGSADPIWEHYFGGADDEAGASVQQMRDGSSILIFGTTSFGRVKKLILMKVNADGNL